MNNLARYAHGYDNGMGVMQVTKQFLVGFGFKEEAYP